MTELASRIEHELATLGTEDRAVHEKAYLKSDLVHFGVTVPIMRSTVKRIARATDVDRAGLLATVEALWTRGIYELRAAAVELLVLFEDRLEAGDIAAIERLLRESKTWALVDMLSATLVGALVERLPQLVETLDRWAADDDFWIRRAAMLSLLGPLRRGAGDFERFGIYADSMLEEKEFFIRKAIGWILREISHKRPELVVEWLAPRAARASGLTLREATRHLTVKQQSRVLTAAAQAKTRAVVPPVAKAPPARRT